MPGSGSHGSAFTVRASVSASSGSGRGFADRALFNAFFLLSLDWPVLAVASVSKYGECFSASAALRENSRVAGHERTPEARQRGCQAVLQIAGQHMHLARQ